MPKIADRYYTIDPWSVVEEGFDPNRSRVSESIFCLANEFMGVRGYFEEGYSGDHLIGSYINNLYECSDIAHDQFFNGFVRKSAFMPNAVDWLYTRISVDGQQLDLAKVKFSGFVRRLDLRRGVLMRELVWHLPGGRELKVEFTRFLSMVNNRMGCQRIALTPVNFSGEAVILSGLNFGVLHEISEGWDQVDVAESVRRQRGVCHWIEARKAHEGETHAIMARTARSGMALFSSFRLAASSQVQMANASSDRFIGVKLTLPLAEGASSWMEKTVVNHWEHTTDEAYVWKTGMSLAAQAETADFSAALTAQTEYWEKTWKVIDVTIDGDLALQQGMRFSLFQFYSNYFGVDRRVNIPCKGLTAEVYFGWVFWDTETYCIPVYLFINPDAARKLLLYRYDRLEGALERAAQLGCRGARFPFASISGKEDCGTWQHADLEDHINVAIFYALWLYTRITGDVSLLYREGIEMLLQMCRYFASRGDWSPKNGDFGIYGVMGPDEFHTMVNNNVYTNMMVKKMFLYTLETMAQMQKKAPAQLKAIVKRVGLRETEPREWRRMAARMRILYDPKTGLYEQHDGFFDLPNVDVKNIPPQQIPIYRHWPYIKLFRYNMIKQPDALLLPFFFSSEHSAKSKRANYEYYENRCIHESSLSPGIHSILAAELGKMREAYEFFVYMARLDLDNFNRNTDQGLHVTSMSGAWLNVVNGFAGMRTDGERLCFAPAIPASWKGYAFNIMYRGSLLRVCVNRKTATFSLLEGAPFDVDIYGKRHRIGTEGVTLALRKSPAAAFVKPARKKAAASSSASAKK